MKEKMKIQTNSNVAISVENYVKKFRSFFSVRNISFNVNYGTIHGLIGPNGSGKTTIIKALIGAYIPTSGKLKIGGFEAGSTNANKLIGYIPERASFPKYLNAIEYLKSMGEMSGLKSKEAKLKALSILDNLGLRNQAHRKPISFSSGMQKKILLAQSLIVDPPILILDEPAANLDPIFRRELFEKLIELRNQGKSIIISSHILAELEKIIDEVTFIYYGNNLFSGSIEEFVKKGNVVFIKTDNNKKFISWLKKNKIKYYGDTQTEIIIKNVTKKQSTKLIQDFISETKVNIISFRNNDLQVAYEKISKENHDYYEDDYEISSNKFISNIKKIFRREK